MEVQRSLAPVLRRFLFAGLIPLIVLFLGGSVSLTASMQPTPYLESNTADAAAKQLAAVSEVVARNDDCSIVVYQAGKDGRKVTEVLAASADFAAAQPDAGEILRAMLCGASVPRELASASTPVSSGVNAFRQCDRDYPRQVDLAGRVAWPLSESRGSSADSLPEEPQHELRTLVAGRAFYGDDKVEYYGGVWSLSTGADKAPPAEISIGAMWTVEGRDMQAIDPPTERMTPPSSGAQSSSSEPLVVWNFGCQQVVLCGAQFAGLVFEGSTARRIYVEAQGSFYLGEDAWYSQGALARKELTFSKQRLTTWAKLDASVTTVEWTGARRRSDSLVTSSR